MKSELKANTSKLEQPWRLIWISPLSYMKSAIGTIWGPPSKTWLVQHHGQSKEFSLWFLRGRGTSTPSCLAHWSVSVMGVNITIIEVSASICSWHKCFVWSLWDVQNLIGQVLSSGAQSHGSCHTWEVPAFITQSEMLRSQVFGDQAEHRFSYFTPLSVNLMGETKTSKLCLYSSPDIRSAQVYPIAITGWGGHFCPALPLHDQVSTEA